VLASPACDLRFNMSHSADVAVCGIGCEHAIGIDVGQLAVTASHGMEARVCMPSERAALARLDGPDRKAAFLTLSTLGRSSKPNGRGVSPVGGYEGRVGCAYARRGVHSFAEPGM
jgi:phosphopantetheinyl transferase